MPGRALLSGGCPRVSDAAPKPAVSFAAPSARRAPGSILVIAVVGGRDRRKGIPMFCILKWNGRGWKQELKSLESFLQYLWALSVTSDLLE